MVSVVGILGDTHKLSARARQYANEVVFGDEWPLTPDHIALETVTFETSTRMKRKHGVCTTDRDGQCTIRISRKTAERAGFEAIEETIRHELVHVYQHQTPAEAVEMGHGPSFERWTEPLQLSGRCATHYEARIDDYTYAFHCSNCGFIGGRYRMCKTVRAALEDRLYCQQCGSDDIEISPPDGPTRVEIVKSQLSGRPVDATSFNWHELEELTQTPVGEPPYTAADLTNIVDKAARYAMEDATPEHPTPITQAHLERAVETTTPSLATLDSEIPTPRSSSHN